VPGGTGGLWSKVIGALRDGTVRWMDDLWMEVGSSGVNEKEPKQGGWEALASGMLGIRCARNADRPRDLGYSLQCLPPFANRTGALGKPFQNRVCHACG
jgi:hypothetical protein